MLASASLRFHCGETSTLLRRTLSAAAGLLAVVDSLRFDPGRPVRGSCCLRPRQISGPLVTGGGTSLEVSWWGGCWFIVCWLVKCQ